MSELTVLMPARNAENTVVAALQSILRGITAESKVLVLNDASEDATGKLLAGIARDDKRVGILNSDKATGLADALNTLVDAADTALVARMDADDIALPFRFARQMRALRRGGVDVVFANAIKFGPSRFALRPQPPFGAGPAATPYELLITNTLLHPTLLGRKSSIVDAGGYRKVPAEDWDLWMRMALRGDRLARIALPALLYRRHSGQVTANVEWQRAHSVDERTAEVHRSLCIKLFGFESDAYPALSGSTASKKSVEAARSLMDDVWQTASRFDSSDRRGVRFNVWAFRRIFAEMHRQRSVAGGNDDV